MALQCSQSSQAVRLCMPLAKFSFANVPAGSVGPIPWTHWSSRNDLFVVLEPLETANLSGSIEKRYRFKVLQDPNILEDFDLSVLALEAQKALSEVQKSPMPNQQPSITIIVKAPCIAMRYPLPDTQVHRYQIRFCKEEDYYETLRIFSSAKVPFIEAAAMSNQTSASIHSNPGHQHGFQPNRPMTAPNPTISNGAYTSHPNPPPSTNTANLGCSLPGNNSRSSEVGVCQSSITNYPSIYRSEAGQKTDVPCSGSVLTTCGSHGLPPVGASAIPSTHNMGSTLQLPATSISVHIPRPSTAPEMVMSNVSHEMPPKRDLPFQRRRKTTSLLQSNGNAKTSKTGATADHNPSIETENIVNSEPQVETFKPAFGTTGKKRAAAKPKKAPASKKPRTATARRTRSGSKRENITLPQESQNSLQENACHAKTTTATQSQADTQALFEKADSVTAAKQGYMGAHDGQPFLHPGKNSESQTKSSEPVAIAAPNNFTASRRTRSQTAAALSAPAPKPTDLPQKQAQTPSEKHSEIRNTQNQTTIPSTPPPPGPTPTPQQPSLLASLLSQPDFANAAFTLPPTTTTSDFYSLPEDEQHTILETWMIQRLNDENFAALLERMSRVWQRIFVHP